MDELKRILEYCEEKLDLDYCAKVEENYKKCLRFEKTDGIVAKVSYSSGRFKPYTMTEIHADMGKMMFNELASFANRLDVKDYTLPTIRANYGVGILPSLFGLNCRIINNDMPWVDHADSDTVKQIIKKGVPAHTEGFGARIIETYDFYRQTLKDYPTCQKAIRLYHPDYQGPFDVAHLIYGADIYLDLYDDPELIHELLAVVTDTYIDTVKRVKPLLNDETGDGFSYHWSNLFPGNIVLRNDSAVNLSPSMYLEFVKPYDDRIAAAVGGASMHYCGRGEQWIHEMAKSEGILGYNFGYVPNTRYDMDFLDVIKPSLYDRKLPVIAYVVKQNELERMDFAKYSTGIVYDLEANTLDDVKRTLEFCNAQVQ